MVVTDLGLGNHLLIRDKELIEKLMNKFSNYQINELYKLWEEILKKELKIN